MAAETLTSTRATATFPVGDKGPAGDCKIGWGTYQVAANVEDGDIFEMHWVPDGATIVHGWMYGEDLDTGIEAIDLMIGWAANNSDVADPNGLLVASVLTGDTSVHLEGAAAGTFMPYGGVLKTAGPKTFTKGGGSTKIQIEANTAATTFAAGQLTLVTLYTVV